MDREYLDVLVKTILNNIKNNVGNSYVVIEGEQELVTDKKMLQVLENLIENHYILMCNDGEIEEAVMRSLIQYYVAIYNDNVSLLNKLLDNNFNFGRFKYYEMNLFILDKRITDKIEEDKLLEIMDGNTELMRNFYRGLYRRRNDQHGQAEEMIEKVGTVLKQNKEIVSKKDSCFLSAPREYFFTIDLLKNFSSEEILNFTEGQKEVLNQFYDRKDKDTRVKLELIKKYNYSKNLIFWDYYYEHFTIDEILKLSEDDIRVYNGIFSDLGYFKLDVGKIIRTIKEIKEVNPQFNYRMSGIIYKALSKEQIMALSPEGVEDVNWCYSCYNLRQLEHIDISEKILIMWIKNAAHKDFLRRNFNKVVKVKKRER